MQIKVEILRQDNTNRPESEKQSVVVETHSRRGETFNIDKTDNVIEGSSTTFTVPNGGRLVLTTPQGVNEVVYDREQGAAVRVGQQENAGKVADKALDRPATPPPHVPPVQTVAPTPAPAAPSRLQPGPVEAAKASQQGGVGRPPGEKPPLPGSPVGSPPAGNEGKDNK